MKDLKALTELFGWKIIEENLYIPTTVLPAIVATMRVEVQGQRWPIMIGLTARGRFLATDEIGGVPMHFQENGTWRYVIDL